MNKRMFFIFSIFFVVCILSIWYFETYYRELEAREGFEGGFGEWEKDADVPLDPNHPSRPVEWNITSATTIIHSGAYSLKLSIDGRADDGTIWIERNLKVPTNAERHIALSFEFYSETESFNTIAAVVAYIGVTNPEIEADFAVLGPANEVAGWKSYSYAATISTDSSGQVWVAVGISVRWETNMTYYIDDVTITW